MTIVLMYSTENGTEEQIEFEDDIVNIDLRRRMITRIDLSPLASCTSLQGFALGQNQLQSIDLSPLTSCTSLQILLLGFNKIQSVDLSPLISCTSLQTLDLVSNKIQFIDLTPLSSCLGLQTLHMHSNQLSNIDLSPLTSCTNLQSLRLDGNPVQSIDLSPIASCTSLQELSLTDTKLEIIDLSPLRSCQELYSLSLSMNRIKEIDLTPLGLCKEISVLDLMGNPLTRVDVTPLCKSSISRKSFQLFSSTTRLETILDSEGFGNPQIFEEQPEYSDIRIKFNTLIRYQNLETIRFAFSVVRGETSWRIHHLLQETLSLLNLRWLGLIDADTTEVLKSILDYEGSDIREYALEVLIPIICRQIDEGRTTIGLDVEKVIPDSPELATRASRILQLREEETRELILKEKEPDRIDLRPLLLTAYGAGILGSLNIRLFPDDDELEKIRAALAELGYKLNTGESSYSITKMSEELKEYIWRVIEYRGEMTWSFSQFNPLGFK